MYTIHVQYSPNGMKVIFQGTVAVLEAGLPILMWSATSLVSQKSEDLKIVIKYQRRCLWT
jgi:hypothetical protein